MPGVVTIACKLPLGIVMQEFRMMPEREQTPMGVRETTVARPTGKACTINGNAAAPGKNRLDPSGVPVHITQGGYALTPNVDADLWESWLSHHKDHPMVVNRMIFAAKGGDVNAISRENDARRSGMEPMIRPTETAPEGDPRAPAKRQRVGDGRAVSAVATAAT